MALKDFALPDLGEGLTESELVSWHVAVGDTVELNQPLAEVETAKALVELPSPFAGVIRKLYAEEGTTVLVGAPIVAFELEGADAAPAADAAPDAGAGAAGTAPVREPVLVGYGPPVEGGNRPARRARKGAGDSRRSGGDSSDSRRSSSDSRSEPRIETTPAETPRSTPPVRKLARDLGIDLAAVTGTGKNGLITREDVEGAVGSPGSSLRDGLRPPQGAVTGDRETRTRIQGVRKHTAAAMVQSAFTAPHASEFLTIDVTPTMELIVSLKELPAFRGKRLNLLTVVAKALCVAVGRNPSVNSRWDEQAQEIVQYHYVNLGIAAATPRGLMVPNIKDADALDLVGLADALAALVETAKTGSSSPAELSGGTISITNIGSFGIDAGTPILNPGEAMILALGAVKRMPWEHHGEIALRQVLTLSVSFDHRLVDGEQGSRFLADVGAILANPAVLLTMV
jgi:pyruvate dehydrogenase E2 component (dihydrolipoamide acetyltransferase)